MITLLIKNLIYFNININIFIELINYLLYIINYIIDLNYEFIYNIIYNINLIKLLDLFYILFISLFTKWIELSIELLSSIQFIYSNINFNYLIDLNIYSILPFLKYNNMIDLLDHNIWLINQIKIIFAWLILFINELFNLYINYKWSNDLFQHFLNLVLNFSLNENDWIINLNNSLLNSIILYVLIKMLIKFKILIRFIIKLIIKNIIIHILYWLKFILKYLFNSSILNQYISKFISLIITLLSYYSILKYLILIILCYFTLIIIIIINLLPLIITMLIPTSFIIYYNIESYFEIFLNLTSFISFLPFNYLISLSQSFLINILNFNMQIELNKEELNLFYYLIKNILLLLIIIIFITLFYLFKKIYNINKYIIVVIPLILNETNENLESTLESSDSDKEEETSNIENDSWSNINTNFKDLSIQDKNKYINNKIESKGLTSNFFLLSYFLGAIIKNTSGNKIEVDKFLDTNLTTIMNDQRNIQLNKHSFVRIKPLLLNNSNKSDFSDIVPYKSDDAFKYELEEDLKNMKEAHNNTEYKGNNDIIENNDL